jgi:iron(III) transport system permease protein
MKLSTSRSFAPLKRLLVQKSFIFAVCTIVMLPFVALILRAIFGFDPDPSVWDHAITNVVPEVVTNTFTLSFLTLIFSLILGVSSAWLYSFTNFKFKKALHLISIIPLIYPLYVLAFIYVGLFEYSGPIMTFFRETFGINLQSIIKIKSLPGVAFVFSLGLHPYVYLLTRQAFDSQGDHLFKVSRSLGLTKFQSFFKVSIPMARPWIFGSMAIILMETMADFGGVSVFNVDTFTTAIYESWTGMFSITTATKLSALLIFAALFVLGVESKLTDKQRYNVSVKRSNGPQFKFGTKFQIIASLWLFCLFLNTFIIPFTQLLFWCKDSIDLGSIQANMPYLFNTLKIAFITALLAVIIATLVTAGSKLIDSKNWDKFSRATTLGYAIPGSIIAVAVFSLFTSFKKLLGDSIDQNTFLYIVLVIGLLTRFLSLSYKNMSSAFKNISKGLDRAAISMGARPREILRRIYLPLLKGGLTSAFLMVFIEVMKEMPMTLMLRPFGQDTLSVKIYEFTSEGDWQRAAIPSLFIVFAGIISVILMTVAEDWSKKKK